MFSRFFERMALVVSIVIMLTFLTACDAPEVEIVIGDEFRGASVQVDFIKVPRGQINQWLSKDVDEYFSPNDLDRAQAVARGDVHSVYYNIPDRKFIGQIHSKHSVWKSFSFDTGTSDQSFDILVMADLPGVSSEGIVEPRRGIIPLYKKAWSGSFLKSLFGGGGLNKLTITISQRGILLDPAPVIGTAP